MPIMAREPIMAGTMISPADGVKAAKAAFFAFRSRHGCHP